MNKKNLKSIFAIIFVLSSATVKAEQIIDLTHSFSAETLHWPTAKPFQLIKGFAGFTPKGYYYAVNDFCTAEHVGTHMDAPVHFAKGHLDISKIPLTQVIGPGIVINVQNKTLKDKDYQISVEDLQNWEKINGQIPRGAIVLFDTGFAKYWSNRKKYLGTDLSGNEGVAQLHFPGLGTEAARWLVKERGVKSLGIDTASIDFGQSKTYTTHQVLGEADVPFFENVADLSKLPVKGFTLYALPMKIVNGTGAPLRIIATLP